MSIKDMSVATKLKKYEAQGLFWILQNLIFVVLVIIPISYDTVLTKEIAEICELGHTFHHPGVVVS